jgi:AbrB family looped-hinge helix DNA binding protein
MRLKARTSTKGQVVIPKEVRDLLGIAPGDEVVFELGDNEARIRPAGRGSGLSELTEIVPRRDKLSRDLDIKKVILSEYAEG